jgi:hypothetical protein
MGNVVPRTVRAVAIITVGAWGWCTEHYAISFILLLVIVFALDLVEDGE